MKRLCRGSDAGRLATESVSATRWQSVVEEINETSHVEGLCLAFKERVQKLADRDGDRISH